MFAPAVVAVAAVEQVGHGELCPEGLQHRARFVGVGVAVIGTQSRRGVVCALGVDCHRLAHHGPVEAGAGEQAVGVLDDAVHGAAGAGDLADARDRQGVVADIVAAAVLAGCGFDASARNGHPCGPVGGGPSAVGKRQIVLVGEAGGGVGSALHGGAGGEGIAVPGPTAGLGGRQGHGRAAAAEVDHDLGGQEGSSPSAFGERQHIPASALALDGILSAADE